MRFLSLGEYDCVLLVALNRLGVVEDIARNVIAARWPMTGASIPAEAAGRGLVVTTEHVAAWLAEFVGEKWADGSPVIADSALFNPNLTEQLFAWCVATGRASLNAVGDRMQGDGFRVVEDIALRPAKAALN